MAQNKFQGQLPPIGSQTKDPEANTISGRKGDLDRIDNIE